MWTITRNVISKQFLGQNIPKDPYPFDYHELVEKINSWKYILKHKFLADKGESILIGLQILNIDYLAICVASAELSLKIVVVDYSRTDDFQDVEYSDPKTKILSPIDIFLHDFSKHELDNEPKRFSKFVFFDTHAKRTYSVVDDVDFVIDDSDAFNTIKNMMPDPSDIHNAFYKLIKRLSFIQVSEYVFGNTVAHDRRKQINCQTTSVI